MDRWDIFYNIIHSVSGIFLKFHELDQIISNNTVSLVVRLRRESSILKDGIFIFIKSSDLSKSFLVLLTVRNSSMNAWSKGTNVCALFSFGCLHFGINFGVGLQKNKCTTVSRV